MATNYLNGRYQSVKTGDKPQFALIQLAARKSCCQPIQPLCVAMAIALLLLSVSIFVIHKINKSDVQQTICLEEGQAAPDFEVTTIEGEALSLSTFSGSPLLLSFMDIQTDSEEAHYLINRNRATMLKSMHQQYQSKGLVVLIIASACCKKEKVGDMDDLINATHNWGLIEIPVAADEPAVKLTQSYGVVQLPVTFLIDGEGTVLKKWEDAVQTFEMATAIESVLVE